MPHRRRRFASAGFTLLELGLVLIVMSLLASGLLAIANQNIRIKNQQEMQRRFDVIENALMAFRKANNRLPCPALYASSYATSSGGLPLLLSVADDSSFGVSAPTPGTCTGIGGSGFNSRGLRGLLPVKTLGLPDEYAYDPWGNRLVYATDKYATGTNAFTTYGVTNTIIGVLGVKDANGNAVASNVVAVILSFGPNGHGGFPYAGATNSPSGTIQKFAGSTNTHEWENCICSSDGVGDAGSVVQGYLGTTFYFHANTTTSSGALTDFDDVGRFYVRSQFPSSTDVTTETP